MKHMLHTFCTGIRVQALFLLLCCSGLRQSAAGQTIVSCTVNAGGNAVVCGASTTLTGTVAGTTGAGTPTWTFVSGPVTPTISSPSSLTTAVSGMTADGNYVFQLSRTCSLGTANSTVTITAHPRPASFTAGPDISSVCATTGTTTLSGVIPSGFTGSWRAVNIYSLSRFGTTVSTNATFSSTTAASPVFSLTNKSNHNIDPAYYAILRITSADGNCSYEDTAIVRFIPNSKVLFPATKTTCHAPTLTQPFLDPLPGSPYFSTNEPGASGTVAAGTSVTLLINSLPAGGTLSYNRFDDNGRIYFNGINVTGSYKFRVVVSNSCGTDTTDEINYTLTGITPRLANVQPSGHGAPEQLAVYANTGSGGEMHCFSKAGTTTAENFYFSIHPSDSPTVTSTVTSIGILPPGGAPSVAVSGAGTYNRTATVTPPSGGWRVGTYAFSISLSNGSCGTSQRYYIHISDNSRPAISVSDQTVCYPGSGAVSATVTLPAIYKGIVNSSYFQELPAYYNFTSISRPAGAAVPQYTTFDARTITNSSTTISNLNRAGDYVFAINFFNGNGVGPFLEAEYACSGTAITDTFTIRLEDRINANAGSDQIPGCIDTASLTGNAAGSGSGQWQLAYAPAGTTPVFRNALSPATSVTGLDVLGNYGFSWTITTPAGACVSTDTVQVTITCSLPLDFLSFTAVQRAQAVALQWLSASEPGCKGFSILHSPDGQSWQEIGFKTAEQNNTVSTYTHTDYSPYMGANYYRIRQTGPDGRASYSPVKYIFNALSTANITVLPNPAEDLIFLQGINEKNRVDILNIAGQELIRTIVADANSGIDISGLPAGTYFIRISNAAGTAQTRKIIKR